MKVLFVCLGNICRSPMAEAILKHLIVAHQKDWVVDSAATSRYEIGSSPDRRGVKALKHNNIQPVSSHKARQVTHEDYNSFDYILCMDESNLSDLKRMAPPTPYKAKIQLLGSYDKDGPRIIEDPYYGDHGEFMEVYQQCYRACENFIMTNNS